MSRCYVGVGARATPPEILHVMEYAARHLAASGWTLRSGHAPGDDQAFERGAGAAAEVYLPWPSFEAEVVPKGVVQARPAPEAYALAAEHHPGWARLGSGARALHARNVHQVLGANLGCPAAFVFCWTADGSLDGRGSAAGGTGQALRLATARDPAVPVFNLARPEHLRRVTAMLD